MKLTQQDSADIRRAFERGESAARLAARYLVSEATIYNHLRAGGGMPDRPRRMLPTSAAAAGGAVRLVDRSRAACRDATDPEVFFPVRQEQYDQALALCGACPVKADCAAEAHQRAADWQGQGEHGLWGVWGGELWRQNARDTRPRWTADGRSRRPGAA